jgi:beta-mannosidase
MLKFRFSIALGITALLFFGNPASWLSSHQVIGRGGEKPLSRPWRRKIPTTQGASAQLPQSLNDLDRKAFGVKTSPFDRPLVALKWPAVSVPPPAPNAALALSLDGTWQLQEAPPDGASDVVMLNGNAGWKNAIPAHIPCSIQTALYQADKIKNPMLQKNNQNILWVPAREWWLRKKFRVPHVWQGKQLELEFDGVDYRGTFWLNGKKLGVHEGMFGGPYYDVSDLVRYGSSGNVLIVKVDPAPSNYESAFKTSVSYGWHYVDLVTSGIWRWVRLQARGRASLRSPFLRAREAEQGHALVDLSLNLWKWGSQEGKYELEFSLIPKNFHGKSFRALVPVTLKPGMNELGFSSQLKGTRRWWPVDMGQPHLYTFRAVLRQGNQIVDVYKSNFGIRTLQWIPTPEGPKPDLYNHLLVVNGHRIWIKGANWCFPDAMLRLTRQRQGHFLRIAQQAHIQFVRVWGGGPNYNDALYDLCDQLGIMVEQEFALLGYSDLKDVPNYQATDMTGHMVRTLRNHPSLAVWSGGNETNGVGRIVELLGRRCLELDGTRAFWRSDPYGGSTHWYGVYWDDLPLLAYRKLADGRIQAWTPASDHSLANHTPPIAVTEFGMTSPGPMSTWKRILPPAELNEWPIGPDSVFVHHTPTFTFLHVQKMVHYSEDFLEPKSLPNLIKGMQLAQGIGLKILIESMRSRKPYTTQTNFYKLTTDYPGASFATVDYYGVPKLSMYLVKEAYRPIHVMSIYNHWNAQNGVLKFSLHAVNDTFRPVQGTLHATIFNAQLQSVWHQDYPVEIPTNKAIQVAAVQFPVPTANNQPLFLLLDLVDVQGKRLDRDWSYYNFTAHRGCLFQRPQTKLTAQWVETGKDKLELAVQNTGSLPALGVTLNLANAAVSYYAHQSLFWLQPGEKKTVEIEYIPATNGNDVPLKQLTVSAWNAHATALPVP